MLDRLWHWLGIVTDADVMVAMRRHIFKLEERIVRLETRVNDDSIPPDVLARIAGTYGPNRERKHAEQ